MSVQSTFETLTVSSTAVGMAAATRGGVSGVPQMNNFSCRLAAAQVRYRTDGVAPTSSVGTLLEIGDVLEITAPDDASRIKFIRTGGTDGVLTIEGFQ